MNLVLNNSKAKDLLIKVMIISEALTKGFKNNAIEVCTHTDEYKTKYYVYLLDKSLFKSQDDGLFLTIKANSTHEDDPFENYEVLDVSFYNDKITPKQTELFKDAYELAVDFLNKYEQNEKDKKNKIIEKTNKLLDSLLD